MSDTSSPVQVAFVNWLSMPETPALVESIVSCSPRPPHSPLSRSSVLGSKGRVLRCHKSSPGNIKQFYFPGGTPLSPSSRSREERSISEFFLGPAAIGPQTCTPGQDDAGAGGVETHLAATLTREQFRIVTKQIAQLPAHCNMALFDAVNGFDGGSTVTMTAFRRFWETHLQTCDRVTRLFRTLGRNAPALERRHFEVLVRDVVLRHPGLRFLSEQQQFQDKYVETVVTRIFYSINRSGNGRITLGELRSSNFLFALDRLDQEDDINEVNQYFSYEHFYVIYCKFWEIDHDHDFLLTRDDLAKYGNYALTSIAIDRIFEVGLRHPPAGSNLKDVMTYEDFIYFLLSEEDKCTPTALDYWFRVCDIDGDGALTVFEIEMFYKAQSVRIHHISLEHISLNDFVCQLMDIVKPEVIGQITRADLRRCKLVRVFFNMLMNLDKFIQYESRDAVLIEQIRATPDMSDWDRFAIVEYSSYSEADNVDLQDEALSHQQYEGIMEPFSESMMVEQNELLL